MIFGRLAVGEALGALLAHTTRLPGRVLHKGMVLDAPAVAALRRAGIADIAVARLQPGDVGEDQAAERLAAALLGPGLAILPAGSGRANLAALRDGLFRANPGRIDVLNAVDPAMTIATLPDATPVATGDLVATIKIIPFAVAGDTLRLAESLAERDPPLRLPPFRGLRVGLLLSTLPGLKPSILQGTTEVTAHRIAALGGHLLPPLHAPHAAVAMAEALRSLLSEGAELLLLAGASAVVDIADEAPAAIVAAGGQIDHFGMPVDPGNLICLGHIGAVPAVVLPGCARSPKLNGIDLILRLIFAGEPAGRAQITAMGVGGLLKDFSPRQSPRLGRHVRQPPPAPQPRVTALVLAAGLSRRMAPRNKLLLPDAAGRAMVARTAAACCASRADEVLVVTGHQADQVERAIRAADLNRPIRFIACPDYAQGLSASLRAGIAAIGPSAQAALVCLGDMPLVTAAMLDRLIAAYDPAAGRRIVVPTCHGQRGNPVLWDRTFFPDIAALSGDSGARSLLRAHPVTEVDIGHEAVLTDFDSWESLQETPLV